MDNLKRSVSSIVLLVFLILILPSFISRLALGAVNNVTPDHDYSFSGGISRAVLESYLSRAITMSDMYAWSASIVKAMEEDEKFKEEVKDMIDGLLPLIREDVE